MRHVSLAVVLFLFWLLLSGYFTFGLLTFGVLSVLAAVAVAGRMRAIDEEGHPLELVIGAITYWPWLIWEIVKAAWSVTKVIVDPALPISPTVVTLKATQKTTSGINTYANSITLTPGTITVGVDGDRLTVHALTQDGADDLLGGGMDARVTQFERATA
ncbi:MAG: Na+/H+ antiporter subunit E [Beijerinckiaceae bacterium]